MQPTAPVSPLGQPPVPQIATGFQLQSSELEGLDLGAGHFTEGKEPTTVKSRGELYATYAGETAKSADFIGAATQSPITSAPPCTAPNSKTSIASIT